MSGRPGPMSYDRGTPVPALAVTTPTPVPKSTRITSLAGRPGADSIPARTAVTR